MKVIKRGDRYHPVIGETFVLVYKGNRHLVKMDRYYRCDCCPLYELTSMFECNKYVECKNYPWGMRIVSAEEDIE